MTETWVRPGREGVLKTRFSDRLKSIKRDRAKAIGACGRDSLTSRGLEIDETAVQAVLHDITTFQYSDSVRRTFSTGVTQPSCESLGFILNGLDGRTHQTGERKRLRKRPTEVPKIETPEGSRPTKIYDLCMLVSTSRINGSLTLEPSEDWIKSKIEEISKKYPERAEAVGAMVDFLRGGNESTIVVQNGRAASRPSSKKAVDRTVTIDGKSYPVRTLKPDGIPAVTLKGKALPQVRISYTTVGNRRVILKIYTKGRKGYDADFK